MPTFVYEALNESGKPQKGTINASNAEEAAARVRSQGYFPTSLREQKAKTKSGGGGGGGGKGGSGAPGGKKKGVGDISINIGGVGSKQLTSFTRQLSTLQDAGLPILRSLAILEQQQKPGLLKDALGGVHEDVSSGSSLSDAMAKHKKAFDTLYVKMIAAGEVGGVLDLILQRLADFLEKAAKLKRRIIGAMIYPVAVVLVASVILLGIMIFIVPQFKEIFDDFDTEIPALTVYLMEFSAWLAGPIFGIQPDQTIPGVVWVALSPIFIWLALKLIRKTKPGKAVIDRITLMMPVMGSLVRKATIAKFTRTLGTLINAGVPILDAVKITADTTGNGVYVAALNDVHESVRQGESFAEPLRKAKVCDSLVVNMIDVGEETGDLDKMLVKIADNYDEEVDVAVAGMMSLLEPLMVVLLGGMVGFIVIALFLPLVKLMQSVM